MDTFPSTNPMPIKEPQKRKFVESKTMVIVLIVLIVCLMCGLTYYILKDNGINLIPGTAKSETTTNTSEDANTTNTTCQSDGTTAENNCDLTATNSGWALFSLAEDDFSVEIPNYWPKLTLGGEQVDYKWAFKPYQSVSTDITGLLPDYLDSVSISFMPSYLPSSVACGGFCVKQHEMIINIYANKSGKSLNEIGYAYVANWTKLNSDEIINIADLGNAKKWGRDVATYRKNFIETSYDVYLVVTKNFVYEVSYHISSDPTESQTVGQKVLDSMKFENASPVSSKVDGTVDVTYMGSGSAISSQYSDMVYFQGAGDYDSTAVVYLIPASKISLSNSSVGKKYSLTYDSSKTTGMGAAAGTSYLEITGTFSYEAK